MISIVICTRNRAKKLEQCIHHFGEVGIDRGLKWELIVVDNNSEDDTAKVVDRVKQRSDLPIQYVFEGRQGLSNARNRGVSEAQQQLIAFVDDDCLVDRGWFASILTEFVRDPSLSILGGRVDLANPNDWPISIRPFSDKIEISSIEQLLALMIGCNMVFTRQVFDRIGLFDPSLGKGTRAGSAEDMDFLYRALKSGLKIVFSPNVLVFHAHGRNLPAVVERVKAEYVRGRGAFYCKHILRGDKQILKLAYWEIIQLVKEQRRGLQADGSRILAGKRLRELATGALFQLLKPSM